MNSPGTGNIVRQAVDGGLPDLDAVLQEARQGLAKLTPTLPVNFRFRWNDIGFAARLDQGPDGPRLRLAGDLGPVPYSAEAAEQRYHLLGLVRWTDQTGKGHFTLGMRQHLNLLGEAPVTEPLTGAGIVAATTCFLLHARPYIDLANEQRGGGMTAGTAEPGIPAKAPATPRKRFSAERRTA